MKNNRMLNFQNVFQASSNNTRNPKRETLSPKP
jgi:hypothetical protein